MKRIFLLSACLLAGQSLFSQAYFNGKCTDALSKKNLEAVNIMVVNGMDTTFCKPDKDGNFSFAGKPGKNLIYAIGEGFVTELNSITAGDKSVNVVNISMVSEEKVETGLAKRAMISRTMAATSSGSGRGSRGARSKSSSPEFGGDSRTSMWSMASGAAYATSDLAFDMTTSASRGIGYGTGRSGALTSGEINDFAKWGLWNDLGDKEFNNYSQLWKYYMKQRFTVQLKNAQGGPVIDAVVRLKNAAGEVFYQARTDNTGKAELWWNMYHMLDAVNPFSGLELQVEAGEKTFTFDGPNTYENGLNFYTIDIPCAVSDQLDIAFVVDATGSMGDEINYLKADLDTMIKEISRENAGVNLRMGSVFYKDKGDDYLTRISPFSTNTHIADNFILDQSAAGGGDFPEAVDDALDAALNQLDWSSAARARLLFLFLDAPPHQDSATLIRMRKLTLLAAAKGVRIIPVACSGADKSTEFLMRSLALATNGTYTFLTNHSGIGNAHLAPSTDIYTVETLSEMLVRITRQFSTVPECSKGVALAVIANTDSVLLSLNPLSNDSIIGKLQADSSIAASNKDSVRNADSIHSEVRPVYTGLVKYYPNPSSGVLNVKVGLDIPYVFIADISGKLLEKVKCRKGDHLILDLSKYSEGIYYLKYPTPRGWIAERIILRF